MNGIQAYSNLSNILMSGRNQINNLRLNQALTRSSGVGKPSSHKHMMSGLSLEDSDFLKKYQSNMQDMKKLADEVIKGGEKTRLAAGTDDLKVAEASGKLSSASDSYTLSVQQLASGQENHSIELNSSTPMPSMSGAIHLKTDKGSYDLYLSAAGSKNNREMLDKFASQINSKKNRCNSICGRKKWKSQHPADWYIWREQFL